ncbi:MAG: sigma-70 family RNA polymerase sigma factor [Chthoniobacterales bacterium]|nr:sigma-70 family RNA polymerase sigma factor [Chthoniobacterales bacterium]
MDSTDRDIYKAAIAGDRDAFELIIRASSRNLFAIAYGVLQNRSEAEDVVQDAFVKAWKSRWHVRDPEKFPAWLATIARHRARDVAGRRRNVPLGDELKQAVDPAVEDQDQDARRSEVSDEVHAALAALPETHRLALTLRYFEALDYATIEQTLGLTNGALRGILGRALQSMRKRLQPALAALD